MKTGTFREFLFRATGKETDPGDMLDLHDNFLAELDRLRALSDLLLSVRGDELRADTLSGLALLLEDVQARMRALLEFGLAKSKSKKKA